MKYLVTGGAGFIGSHITEGLLERGDSVVVYDNFSTGTLENLSFAFENPLLEIVKADLSEVDRLQSVASGLDGIFHQAAIASVPFSVENPLESFRVNVQGTLNVFEAARNGGVGRVVFASSASVYGDNSDLPLKETAEIKPLSPYALHKVMAEAIALFYYKTYSLSSVVLRYFNVFGPRSNPLSSYSGVITKFIRNLQNDEPCEIFGDGNQSRDFVFVKDVVTANILGMDAKEISHETYNVGAGQSTTILELHRLISTSLGKSNPPVFQQGLDGEVLHSQADISRFKKLGYNIEFDLNKELNSLILCF